MLVHSLFIVLLYLRFKFMNAKFLCCIKSPRSDRPWSLPTLLYNGYRVIPGGKAGGAWR
jgi:hypothetical protein